tara:strand:+ start:103 stop:462 length:360 start_codon:yes stop_codon:yes gene_type:complete
MATYSKIVLSGSTDGRGILVDDDATAGKLIHTGSSTATTYDEVWIYAANYDSSDRKLTIEWGSASAGDLIEVTIPTEAGLVLVVPGLIIKGNASPLVVRAFAATTSSIQLFGYVNQITA